MAYGLFDLSGKVALVTGGNGGIGLGFAEAVAQAGADVCIWGRNAEKNEAAIGKLDEGDGGLIAVSATGEIALVFNSAGMFRGAADSAGRFDVAIWE